MKLYVCNFCGKDWQSEDDIKCPFCGAYDITVEMEDCEEEEE